MRRLEHDIPPETLVGELRIGQQQIVEIAKALAQDARILILDEPTSALSAAEVEILFRVIADLKRRGVGIVYISHRLEELIRIGDWITVLRDGRITGSRAMAGVDVPLDRAEHDRGGVEGLCPHRRARARGGGVPRGGDHPAAAGRRAGGGRGVAVAPRRARSSASTG